MTFYINSFSITPTGWKDYIGLFDANNWEGRGNFSGWYGAEYYRNTNLLAYYPFESNGVVNFKNKTGLVTECNEHYDEIQIGSCYWEKKIEAASVEEAVRKFMSLEFD